MAKNRRTKEDLRQLSRRNKKVMNESAQIGSVGEEYLLQLALQLTLQILIDPHVGSHSEARSVNQLSFSNATDLWTTIHVSITSNYARMLRKEPLVCPLSIPLYQLLQPLLNPVVKTSNGTHRITVQAAEPVALTGAQQALTVELFGEKGYFEKKYGWKPYNSLSYLTQEHDYRPIHYTVQTNKAGQKKGHEFWRRCVNPRAIGLFKYDGDVIGEVTNRDETATVRRCIMLHLMVLPQLTLTSTSTTLLSLDRTKNPRVPHDASFDVVTQARVALQMMLQGGEGSLLGVSGMTTHVISPDIFYAGSLTYVQAYKRLPSASVPNALNEPPSPTALAKLFTGYLTAHIPEIFLPSLGVTGVTNLLYLAPSMARGKPGTITVPTVLGESITAHRIYVSPMDESPGVETGYSLALPVLPKNVPIDQAAITDEIENLMDQLNTQTTTTEWGQEVFALGDYLRLTNADLNNTLTTCPIKSKDVTEGLFSVRSLSTLNKTHEAPGSSDIAFTYNPANQQTEVNSTITHDTWFNIKDTIQGPEIPSQDTLELRDDQAGGVTTYAFYLRDASGGSTTDLVVYPDMSFSSPMVLTHFAGYSEDVASQQVKVYAPCVQTFPNGELIATTQFNALRNLLLANGHNNLMGVGHSNAQNLPFSSIMNPTGPNNNLQNEFSQWITGRGGWGDFTAFLGDVGKGVLGVAAPVLGGVASAIGGPMAGNLVGAATGSLLSVM